MIREDWECVFMSCFVIFFTGILFGFGAWMAFKILGVL